MKKIGFIGVGVMGHHMVNNLIKNNYELHLYSRRKESLKEYQQKVACYDNIKDLCKNVDLIISCVGYPKDVLEVSEQVLKYAKKDSYYIDMSTSSPSLAEEIFFKGEKKNIKCFDAPVTGGELGAKMADLSIFVGGKKEYYSDILEILSSLGSHIIYCGAAGSGQKAKLANQIAIAANLIGTAELITFSNHQKLNTFDLLAIIGSGSASSWQLINNGYKMLNHDYKPGFYVKHLLKDLKLAQDEAKKKKLNLPFLNKYVEIFTKLFQMGYENCGTQSIIELYEREEKDENIIEKW